MCLKLHPAIATAAHGSQIHCTSDHSVSTPRAEKKPAPMGETLIGANGANMRASLKGQSNAAPSPPSVSASSSPWLAMAAARKAKPNQLRASFYTSETAPAHSTAIASAWVAPRWPHVSS